MRINLHCSAFLAAMCMTPPVMAQSLTGTVTAADTGEAMVGATVLAIQRSASVSQKPTIYQSVVDSAGHFTVAASPGQYAVCVHPLPQSLYLDPCQWGSPIIVTVGEASSTVPLTLLKGVRFIVRVHDLNRLFPQAETVTGTAVSASLASPSVKLFILPLVYSDSLIHDYGTVIPINVPMSVTVSSKTLSLADKTGAPVSASPMPFQVLPTDIAVTGAPPSPLARMFPPPDARIVHVYATGLTSAGSQLVVPK